MKCVIYSVSIKLAFINIIFFYMDISHHDLTVSLNNKLGHSLGFFSPFCFIILWFNITITDILLNLYKEMSLELMSN